MTTEGHNSQDLLQTALNWARYNSLGQDIHDEVDADVYDYMTLPDYGNGYFNLVDASMLVALDFWWSQNGGDGDPNLSELAANSEVQKAVQPLLTKVTLALNRAIVLKELKVQVCARDLSTNEPVSRRTFAHVRDLQHCLYEFGLGGGHLMRHADALDDDDSYVMALAISRRRASIRFGLSPDPEQIPSGDPFSVIENLRTELKAKDLHIAHLKQKGASRQGDTASSFGQRQRNNLYRTVGALLSLLLPHFRDKQEALIGEIESRFKGKEGLSKRQLETVLPLAKKSLNEGG